MPLSTRLFQARLVMVETLDKQAAAGSHFGKTRVKLGDPLNDAQRRDELAGCRYTVPKHVLAAVQRRDEVEINIKEKNPLPY